MRRAALLPSDSFGCLADDVLADAIDVALDWLQRGARRNVTAAGS